MQASRYQSQPLSCRCCEFRNFDKLTAIMCWFLKHILLLENENICCSQAGEHARPSCPDRRSFGCWERWISIPNS